MKNVKYLIFIFVYLQICNSQVYSQNLLKDNYLEKIKRQLENQKKNRNENLRVHTQNESSYIANDDENSTLTFTLFWDQQREMQQFIPVNYLISSDNPKYILPKFEPFNSGVYNIAYAVIDFDLDPQSIIFKSIPEWELMSPTANQAMWVIVLKNEIIGGRIEVQTNDLEEFKSLEFADSHLEIDVEILISDSKPQTNVFSYSYDNSGNRINRTLDVTKRTLMAYEEPEMILTEEINQRDIKIHSSIEGQVSIEFSSLNGIKNGAIQIYSFPMGTPVLNRKIQNLREDLDISLQPSGIYVLLIDINGERTSFKIKK